MIIWYTCCIYCNYVHINMCFYMKFSPQCWYIFMTTSGFTNVHNHYSGQLFLTILSKDESKKNNTNNNDTSNINCYLHKQFWSSRSIFTIQEEMLSYNHKLAAFSFRTNISAASSVFIRVTLIKTEEADETFVCLIWRLKAVSLSFCGPDWESPWFCYLLHDICSLYVDILRLLFIWLKCGQ